jgi:hypothetical protein
MLSQHELSNLNILHECKFYSMSRTSKQYLFQRIDVCSMNTDDVSIFICLVLRTT